MSFSIRLSEDERQLAESYAKLHSYSLSEAFKRALFEKIEDEYDIAVAESAYQEYVDGGRKSTPVKDFWRELDEEV
ncbi:MAG: antitoxin [Clostridia bacterium]|nr:antitoxin [Clostridia bacterium]